jgi:hypothetical protein
MEEDLERHGFSFGAERLVVVATALRSEDIMRVSQLKGISRQCFPSVVILLGFRIPCVMPAEAVPWAIQHA